MRSPLRSESVRYEKINAMRLNEFLKEHRKIENFVRIPSHCRLATERNCDPRSDGKRTNISSPKVLKRLEANEPALQVVKSP